MHDNTNTKVANSTSLTAIFLMVFSGALLLFLIGMYIIIGLHSDNIVSYLKEHTAIVFELSENMGDNANLKSDIELDDRLKKQSIEYISADDGLKYMQNEMGNDLLPDEMVNPFSDLIVSFVNVDYTSDEGLASLKATWKADERVKDVYFQNEYLTFWDVWKTRILKITFGATLILLFITVMLIFSTVKLTVFMKKKNIEILELVGASWDFIRAPFLRVSIKMGLVSALMASIFIALILSFLVWMKPFLVDYFNWYYMLITIVILVVFGIVLQWISTRIVLNRMLKDTIEHLK